jgi:DNA-binding NarL/FixJ family response regulator
VIRIFADLSTQLAPLLAQLPANELPPVFVAQVCSAVELDLQIRTQTAAALPRRAPKATNPSDHAVEGAQIGSPTRPLNVSEDINLHQVLTYREMDVLRLLDKRLTNKEIARQLGISTETVRQHTVKLFRKLHVNNRRQAIVAAHALGLFAEAK